MRHRLAALAMLLCAAACGGPVLQNAPKPDPYEVLSKLSGDEWDRVAQSLSREKSDQPDVELEGYNSSEDQIALRDGRIVYDGPSSALNPSFLSELYGAESEELFLPSLASEAKPEHTNGHAIEIGTRAAAWHNSEAAVVGA
jgi:hypothetical protein